MFSSVIRLLFSTASDQSPRTARLGLDVFEDRVVPASITFANGVLYVAADAATNDVVQITAIGTHRDGSTGVKVVSNVTGTWTTQKFGDAAHPVTNIALDMKDGNDFVSVSNLRATTVFVGEGNGNNFVHLGDTKSGGLVTGSGQNVVSIGGGSVNVFGDGSIPGVSAGSAVYLGWGYQFQNGGKDIFTTGGIGNNNANVIHMATAAGETSIVDVNGNGNNFILGGRGNDAIYVLGNGNNTVRAGAGDDRVTITGSGDNAVHVGTGANTVFINGDGNNSVWTRGSGSVGVNGSGKNVIHARYSANLTIALNGAGAGSSVVASLSDGVFVDDAQVAQSGTYGNVKVKFVES